MTRAVLHRFLCRKVDLSKCSTLSLFTNDTPPPPPYNNNMSVNQRGEKNDDF